MSFDKKNSTGKKIYNLNKLQHILEDIDSKNYDNNVTVPTSLLKEFYKVTKEYKKVLEKDEDPKIDKYHLEPFSQRANEGFSVGNQDKYFENSDLQPFNSNDVDPTDVLPNQSDIKKAFSFDNITSMKWDQKDNFFGREDFGLLNEKGASNSVFESPSGTDNYTSGLEKFEKTI